MSNKSFNKGGFIYLSKTEKILNTSFSLGFEHQQEKYTTTRQQMINFLLSTLKNIYSSESCYIFIQPLQLDGLQA